MRKISSDAVAVFIGDFGARALGFLATAYLARTLKADGFGVVGISLGFLSYAIWFADLGTSTIGTRETAMPAEKRAFKPGEILALKLVLTLGTLVLGQIIVRLLYGDSLQWRVTALFLGALLPSVLVIEWYFQGRRDFVQIGISRAVNGLVYLGLLWFFLGPKPDNTVVPIAYGLATLAAALWLLMRPGIRRDRDLRPEFRVPRFQALLKSTSVIGTGASFGQIVQFLPPVVIGYFCSTTEAGLFVAAMKIVYVMLIADRVFASLFLPAISKLWHAESDRIRGLLPPLFRTLVTASFALCTVCSVFSAGIVTAVFGPGFAGAAVTLSILSWFVAWTLLNSLFAYSLIAAGHEANYSRATVIGGLAAAAGIVLCAVLLSATAVAVAVSLGELFIMILMFMEFRKYFHIPVFYPSLLSITISAVFIAGSRLAGIDQLWLAPVFLAAFAGIALLAGGLSIRDIREVTGA